MGKKAHPVEPGLTEVDAAARAWFEWQFKGRRWDEAPASMQEKFREGALQALRAAYETLVEDKAAVSN